MLWQKPTILIGLTLLYQQWCSTCPSDVAARRVIRVVEWWSGGVVEWWSGGVAGGPWSVVPRLQIPAHT